MSLPTVDDASYSPQQQDNEYRGGLLTLLARHTAQEDDVDCERRHDDESVEYLPPTEPESYTRDEQSWRSRRYISVTGSGRQNSRPAVASLLLFTAILSHL